MSGKVGVEDGLRKDRPIQPDELSRAQASLTLTLPGSWETMAALAGAIGDIVTFGLDDRYYDTFAEKVRAQTVQSLTAAAADGQGRQTSCTASIST